MTIISSIKEDELQSEIKENVNDSVSYRLENAVKISSNTSFECELSEKITQFDDSSIHQMVDFICSSTEIKENGVKISTNTSIECEQGGGNRITLLGDSIVQEMVDYAGSSIKEDELKQELTGKGKIPPFSSDSENGFKTNFDVTGIHDSNLQEKQEICLNITEAQNDVQSAISHDNFVILNGLKGNFTDDNFVVVEIQEDLGKDCNLISQSHNLIEMSSNGLRRSEDNWDRFVNVNNVNQKIGGKKDWDKWVVQNGDKKLEILEIQGKGNGKMKVSLNNNRKPSANHSAGVSTNVMNNFRIVPRIGNGYQRKEIYDQKRVRSYYSENIKQDFNRKKENFSKRNWNGIIKEKPSLLMVLAEARNACPKKVDGYKRRYSRNELEALRFVNCDEQRQIWKEIYTGLGPVVARELYFAAESSNQLRNGRNGSNIRNNDQNQQAGKQKVNAPILALPSAPKGRGTHLPIVEVKSC